MLAFSAVASAALTAAWHCFQSSTNALHHFGLWLFLARHHCRARALGAQSCCSGGASFACLRPDPVYTNAPCSRESFAEVAAAGDPSLGIFQVHTFRMASSRPRPCETELSCAFSYLKLQIVFVPQKPAPKLCDIRECPAYGAVFPPRNEQLRFDDENEQRGEEDDLANSTGVLVCLMLARVFMHARVLILAELHHLGDGHLNCRLVPAGFAALSFVRT